MLRVVFDTVGFVRSLINPQSFWGKIIFQYKDQYTLVLSKPVLQEIFEVLNRPEITVLFKSLEGLDKDRVVEIISQVEIVEVSNILAISRDPKDDKFLATAKAAHASYLVSADRDLLDLKAYKGIQIIDARGFLKLLD